ncbi:MAG: hypothetical protein AAF443_08900 [Chlamydiota bacterium]
MLKSFDDFALFKGVKALFADDDVIDNFDVENIACFHEAVGDVDVGFAGLEVARRVVVDEDDVGGGFVEGDSENFCGVYGGATPPAHAGELQGKNFKVVVEGKNPKVFLYQVYFSFFLIKDFSDDPIDILWVLGFDVFAVFKGYFHRYLNFKKINVHRQR